jgi:hypothetical protein
MMQQKLHPQTRQVRATLTHEVSYNDAWFELMFVALDRLHDAVSQQPTDGILPVAPADMVGWLEDIIYTAQEAIVEIRDNTPDETVSKAERLGQEARSTDEVMF